MRAGDLDRTITIRRAAIMRNELNEPVETWSDLVTVRAARGPARAGEGIRSDEITAEIRIAFTIRWSSQVGDVNPRDRLVYLGREYDITAVDDPDRNVTRVITAVARSD